MSSGNFIAFAVTIITLIISFFAAFTAWMFNRVSLRKTTRQDHDSMAIDINKILVSNPELFAIYDNHPVAKIKSMDPIAIAKREAMILVMLNSAHVVFDFYHSIIVNSKIDETHWNGWQEFTRNLIKESSEAREVYRNYHNQFSLKFSKFVDGIINEIID